MHVTHLEASEITVLIRFIKGSYYTKNDYKCLRERPWWTCYKSADRGQLCSAQTEK